MSQPLRIVATSDVPAVARDAFGFLGRIVVVDQTWDGNAELAEAEVLIVRTRPVDGALLDRTPHLRAITRTGVGLDGIDLDAATRRGLPVIYAPGVGTRPMAEGTMALIFAVSKRIRELERLVVEGRWDDRYRYPTRDLNGATLGVVGLGRIGAAVARLGRRMGMTVIAHEHRPGPRFVDGDPDPIPNVSLEELFSRADVISLHCDLNESTRASVDLDLLSKAGPGAILINAARGEIVVSHEALREALDRGWLAGVGLDVFTPEPPAPDDPILHDARVICTPHSIGLTGGWNESVFRSLAVDLRRLLDGETPHHVANPDVLGSPRTVS